MIVLKIKNESVGVYVKSQKWDWIYEDPCKVWGGPKDDEKTHLFWVGWDFWSPYPQIFIMAMLVTKNVG